MIFFLKVFGWLELLIGCLVGVGLEFCSMGARLVSNCFVPTGSVGVSCLQSKDMLRRNPVRACRQPQQVPATVGQSYK